MVVSESLQIPSYTVLRRVCRAASRICEDANGRLETRMPVGIYGAAAMVDWTMGCVPQLFVPKRPFEVGAEKPDGLRGVTRRNREVQIGLRSLSNVVSAWAGNCKTG
jgi:hypothetical protein